MERKTVLLLVGVAIVTGGLLYAFRKKVGAAVDSAVQYALDINQHYHVRQLHASVREKFARFITEVEKLGYKVIITSSYRSFAEQDKLHRENSQNAKPGYSEHNYGFAIDINAQKGFTILHKSSPKAEWEASGIPKLAESLGLNWGGSSYRTYYDPVHFAVKVDTGRLRQIAMAQQGSDIAKIRGNEIKLAA